MQALEKYRVSHKEVEDILGGFGEEFNKWFRITASVIEESHLQEKLFEMLIQPLYKRKLYDYSFYIDNVSSKNINELIVNLTEVEKEIANILEKNELPNIKNGDGSLFTKINLSFTLRIKAFVSEIVSREMDISEALLKVWILWLMGNIGTLSNEYLKDKDKSKESSKNSLVAANKKEAALIIIILAVIDIVGENELEETEIRPKDFFGKILYLKMEEKVIYFYSDIIIERIESISSVTSFLEKYSTKKKRIFYRGHSNINYKLLPSRLRDYDLIKNEYYQTNMLMRESYEEFSDFRFNVDLLIKMQHYNFPTRLLDLTENYLIALYFACLDDTQNGELIVLQEEYSNIKFDDSGNVIMLAALPFIKTKDKEKIIKSYKLMGPSEKKNSLNDEEHVINKIILKKIKGNVSIFRPEIVPSDLFENIVFLGKKNNKRIINQQGAFIICGLYENKVDETENKLYEKTIKADDGRSMVLLVPASKKRALLEMLEDVGINEKHVYPELTYISKWASNLKEEVK